MDEAQKQELIDRFRLAGFVEACRLLEEGISSMKDIDIAMLAGAGYDKGPFAWADSVGLDTVKERLEALSAKRPEVFSVPKVLVDLVGKGYLGEKTKRGFYEY